MKHKKIIRKIKVERIERRKARKIRTNIQKLECHINKYRGNTNTTERQNSYYKV